jgi:hypothetical protein
LTKQGAGAAGERDFVAAAVPAVLRLPSTLKAKDAAKSASGAAIAGRSKRMMLTLSAVPSLDLLAVGKPANR